MCDMDNLRLPIPNPREWMTRRLAAAKLGVSVRTVERMVENGVLTEYRPSSDGSEEAPLILWVAEVERVALARQVAGIGAARIDVGAIQP